MKRLTLMLVLAVMPSICVMQAGEQKIVVPPGKTYVKLAKGKEVARYTAGQTVGKVTDCVKITCPRTFEKGIVCWECHERLTTPQ